MLKRNIKSFIDGLQAGLLAQIALLAAAGPVHLVLCLVGRGGNAHPVLSGSQNEILVDVLSAGLGAGWRNFLVARLLKL